MTKLAYRQGCQAALTKLGMTEGNQFMQALADRFRTGGHTSANTRAFVNLDALSPVQRKALHPFLYPGRYRSLNEAAQTKRSSYRVPVTSDQTPQAETWKATNAEEQQRSVDSAWEQHDKRQQLFTRPQWPD